MNNGLDNLVIPANNWKLNWENGRANKEIGRWSRENIRVKLTVWMPSFDKEMMRLRDWNHNCRICSRNWMKQGGNCLNWKDNLDPNSRITRIRLERWESRINRWSKTWTDWRRNTKIWRTNWVDYRPRMQGKILRSRICCQR